MQDDGTNLERHESTPAARCAALGLPVCELERDGTLIAVHWRAGDVKNWIGSNPVRAVLAEAQRKWHAEEEPMPSEAAPGLWLLPLATDEATNGRRTVALATGPAALDCELFKRACEDACVDEEQTRAEFTMLAHFDAGSARTAFRAARMAASEAAKLAETRTTIDGFTNQLTDAFDTIEFLYTIGRSMRDPRKPAEFVRFLVEHLHGTMSFGWIAVRFARDGGGIAALSDRCFQVGNPPHPEPRFEAALRALLVRVLDQADAKVLEDVEGLSTPGDRQVVAQPISLGGRLVGVFGAGGKHGDDSCVSSYDLQLLEAAAGYVGAFLETVSLYEDQRKLFLGTVQALTAAIDAKDHYTRGHSERVAHLAVMISRALGGGSEEETQVRLCGLVHDVGKIGVPEAVLTKSGRLTDEEFNFIKCHPSIGHTILKDIPQLGTVLPGVLHHHERWDGRGYPHGLAAERIPRLARIISVADTFDAMSSTRSYRPAMPRENVRAELLRCAGTQLDPALVPVFLSIDLSQYDELVERHSMRLAA